MFGTMSSMSTSKDAARKSRKKKKVTRRARDYVLPKEMDRVLKAAIGTGRHGHRNYTMILMCYRHALRVGELVELRWRDVDFKRKELRVTRLPIGINTVQPLGKSELLALRKLKREYSSKSYLFVTDRGRKVSVRDGRRIVARAGREARLKYNLHPQMLRHGCGHALAQAGHDIASIQHYLGHRNIRHTLRYMAGTMPQPPFKSFWRN